MSIEKDILKIFNENDIYYDWWVTSNNMVVIFVEWGDWKHDHLFLKYTMKANGYRLVSSTLVEEDGSDCYSAEYKFVSAKLKLKE